MGVQLFVSFIYALGRLAKNLKVAKNGVIGARAKQRQLRVPRLNIHAPFEYIRGRVQRTLAEISQRYGVTQDGIADQRAEGTVNHHLNWPSQQLLQIRDKTGGEPWRCLAWHVDEEVNVAFGCFFAACHRTEQPHVSGAVTRRHAQDFFALLPNLFADTHVVYSILTPPRIPDVAASEEYQPLGPRRPKQPAWLPGVDNYRTFLTAPPIGGASRARKFL